LEISHGAYLPAMSPSRIPSLTEREFARISRALADRRSCAAVMGTADRPKLTAAVTRANEASVAETTPGTSLAPFAAVVPRLPIVPGAQTTADKPSCVGDTGPKATVFPSSCASRAWFGW
jgi:hypothetical protein